MSDQELARPTPSPRIAEQRADAISDEEAEAEIDFPPTKTIPRAETTPSVRIAIDKAADMLRQLRGED